MAVSVLVVEDVAELRAVLRQALRLRGGFDVVAEASDGVAAIEAAGRHQPDIVVLDLGLPDLAGHEVLTGIRAAAPSAQVVVYTGTMTPEGFPLGHVDAYLSKDKDVRYLIDLVTDLSRRGRQAAAIELGPDPGDVAVARRFLVDHCRRWGCHDVVEDAELVVSELVTNALIHAGTHCTLRAGLTDTVLRLEVIDAGAGTPDPRATPDDAEHGRGLLLVSALCAAWGVETVPADGKVVWAELIRSDQPSGGDDPTRRAANPVSTPEDADRTSSSPSGPAGTRDAGQMVALARGSA